MAFRELWLFGSLLCVVRLALGVGREMLFFFFTSDQSIRGFASWPLCLLHTTSVSLLVQVERKTEPWVR